MMIRFVGRPPFFSIIISILFAAFFIPFDSITSQFRPVDSKRTYENKNGYCIKTQDFSTISERFAGLCPLLEDGTTQTIDPEGKKNENRHTYNTDFDCIDVIGYRHKKIFADHIDTGSKTLSIKLLRLSTCIATFRKVPLRIEDYYIFDRNLKI